MLLGNQQLGVKSCRFFYPGIKLRGNQCAYMKNLHAYRALPY